MDHNANFLTNALLRHFEESEQMRSSRDNSNVEDEEPEEDGGVPEDNEPEEEERGHRIDTEVFRCSCKASMCFTCGWCSAQCLCPEKSREGVVNQNERSTNS